ncbi:uncharacterized protein ACLA_034670 [Aspergillus clavatus NRRL 1]|uniref:Uncharacterized protein n=1 Tax=Aspergillus clavatus (strain ATCC 1007 / CBS 513.65 / DSM 816 / NCTC 3887 / NRRL 1 / QM 1276 / 107) TaxID=344612 RepID=A1CJE0_ASPCL|nr:uncharacterized protein ACLA_034670 [Aspergillus clavatus NRRL 1]EAW09264.1 hypothetical protein ACLA_034670 [Aspergillus clavatus NRRL 1]
MPKTLVGLEIGGLSVVCLSLLSSTMNHDTMIHALVLCSSTDYSVWSSFFFPCGPAVTETFHSGEWCPLDKVLVS